MKYFLAVSDKEKNWLWVVRKLRQGRIQGGVLGVKREIFFNLLGVFKKKNPNTPPSKNFWICF